MRGFPVQAVAPLSRNLTTVERLGADLGVDYTTRLADLVAQASALCEGHCQRMFARATWVETFDGHYGTLVLSHIPTKSIASITIDEVPFDVSAWRLRSESGMLLWRGLQRPREEQEIVVRYVAGYLLPGDEGRDLPADIERACIETAKWIYYASGDNSRDPAIVADSSEGIGQTRWAVPAAGAAGLPANAADALQHYVLRRA